MIKTILVPASGSDTDAVVFDTAPQLKAMLLDVLPRDENGEPLAGSVALFLYRDGKLMSATDPQFDADPAALAGVRESMSAGGARAVRLGNEYYALGAKRDKGYREYVGIGAHAIPDARVVERHRFAMRDQRILAPGVLVLERANKAARCRG